jgi:cytochrome c oxidase accessory protein FixG
MLSARPVQGFWRRLRWWMDGFLVAVLVCVPWIRIGGEPLVLLDIPARRFHVLGLVIFPDELYFLWLIVIGLALALFFFTALAGRLWCGWACPQTVLTDVYAAAARFIQGWSKSGPPARVAVWRRVATHAVWALFSLGLGFHLVGYFRSPYQLVADLAGAAPSPVATGFWLVAAALAHFDLVVLKQTFCKYLCPYARFQGVMFDRDTLVVGYDRLRGEPRGKRGTTSGDCIDCGLCVAVCPTQIDIRQGLQLECIACTQCIDACDGVMERIDRPPNLIGYRSLVGLERERPARPLRPRVLAYGGLLACAVAAFAAGLGARNPLAFEVERNRGALSQRLPDGRVSNAYSLHVENRAREARSLRIRVEGAPGDELLAGVNPFDVPAASVREARVFVVGDDGGVGGPRPLRFVLEPVDDPQRAVARETTFVSLPPAQGAQP